MEERVSDSLLSTGAEEKGWAGVGVGTMEVGGRKGILFLLSCYRLLDLGSF